MLALRVFPFSRIVSNSCLDTSATDRKERVNLGGTYVLLASGLNFASVPCVGCICPSIDDYGEDCEDDDIVGHMYYAERSDGKEVLIDEVSISQI